MSQWRSGTFWASAIFGWFAVMIVLAMMVSFFGSETMSRVEGIGVAVAQQLLSLAAGYAYGRQQFQLRKPTQVGFPVITKGDDDSAEKR